MACLDSRLGRSLGALVAASLLAGVSMGAGAGSLGEIRLQLGKVSTPLHQGNRFVYEAPDGTQGPAQTFKVVPGSKCFLGNWGGTTLVSLTAFGPNGANPGQLGLGTDSIGVYDNSKGVSCYRMTGSLAEGVVFSLDDNLSKVVPGSPTGTIYFDRLELDVEVKQNAELVLKVYKIGFTDPLNVYTLRSGNRILGDGTSGESDPEHPIFNCGASSDSGPDSGPSDNCRWIINDIGNRFTLEPKPNTDSEVSLEGGGDFADAYANNTVIHLTTLVDTGELWCLAGQGPITTAEVGGGPVASCQTTRINASLLPGQDAVLSQCVPNPVPYRLESFLGESRCEIVKEEGIKTQFAGSIEIAFKPEDNTPGGLDPWGVPKTYMRFDTENGSFDFYPERCQGTVVTDANGNKTILEVLYPKLLRPDWVEDQDPDNAYLEWACVLDHREVSLGDDKVQVIQTILYWGDLNYART